MSSEEIFVTGWPKPKGYANGRTGRGAALHVGGQIGWDEHGTFTERGLVGQFGKALDNVLAVVRAAGGAPSDIARMTVYVTDIEDYRQARKQLGPVWRARMGQHYPAMALVGVTALVEEDALVEIEATAYIGGDS
ncbi:MAG TPA: RidA family protein [Kofleriaceae bacterium]|nr:RidA family protein [Kofleriaceae bacterium]